MDNKNNSVIDDRNNKNGSVIDGRLNRALVANCRGAVCYTLPHLSYLRTRPHLHLSSFLNCLFGDLIPLLSEASKVVVFVEWGLRQRQRHHLSRLSEKATRGIID